MDVSRWLSASFETQSGIAHMPNLPTEEIFTTPDWRRTEGVVRSTYPLVVPGIGVRVEGLAFRFSEGRIVDVEAEGDGADIIRTQLASDERAPFLGEIALVDGSSRVRQTGIVFYNTLFDENATCHIAYGSGLPMAVDGADGKSADELLEQGVNVSSAHTDFMIGGPRSRSTVSRRTAPRRRSSATITGCSTRFAKHDSAGAESCGLIPPLRGRGCHFGRTSALRATRRAARPHPAETLPGAGTDRPSRSVRHRCRAG